MEHAPPLYGILLAGGQSRRMGQEKALLDWHGEPLLHFMVRRLQAVCSGVLVVTNSPAVRARALVPTIPDERPGDGPLAGIQAGLRASPAEYNLIVACDMPLIQPALVAYLGRLAPGYDAVVPRRRAGWEPLCAVYAQRCLPVIDAQLERDGRKVDHLFPALRVRAVSEEELRAVDPTLQSFRNLNTPEEYAELLAVTKENDR